MCYRQQIKLFYKCKMLKYFLGLAIYEGQNNFCNAYKNINIDILKICKTIQFFYIYISMKYI